MNPRDKSAIIDAIRTYKKAAFTMKHICIGILAHVDSGKTTLSEGLLYASGALRKLGRVDHGDAFLDTDALERERGITIFSKQAMLKAGEDLAVFDHLSNQSVVDFSTLQKLSRSAFSPTSTREKRPCPRGFYTPPAHCGSSAASTTAIRFSTPTRRSAAGASRSFRSRRSFRWVMPP